jgi:hypothetical protein
VALVVTSAAGGASSRRSGDVSGGDAGSSNGSSNGSGRSHHQQHTLLMLSSAAPCQDAMRWCVPVFSTTTFLREWSALMSVNCPRLMPLVPYLLKGSPVVSSIHLRYSCLVKPFYVIVMCFIIVCLRAARCMTALF